MCITVTKRRCIGDSSLPRLWHAAHFQKQKDQRTELWYCLPVTQQAPRNLRQYSYISLKILDACRTSGKTTYLSTITGIRVHGCKARFFLIGLANSMQICERKDRRFFFCWTMHQCILWKKDFIFRHHAALFTTKHDGAPATLRCRDNLFV